MNRRIFRQEFPCPFRFHVAWQAKPNRSATGQGRTTLPPSAHARTFDNGQIHPNRFRCRSPFIGFFNLFDRESSRVRVPPKIHASILSIDSLMPEYSLIGKEVGGYEPQRPFQDIQLILIRLID